MTPPITASAVRLRDGKELPLPQLTSISVASSLASPAQSAVLTAGVDAFPGELGAVTVRQEGRVLFTGRIDRQTASLSGEGRLLRLEARSKGALLLDNEAAPCTLTGAQLTAVFQLFIQPYGFLLVFPGASRSLATYTVHKGLSEWDALCGFTRRVYGLTPYVTGEQVTVDTPRSASPLVVGGAGLPFASIRHVFEPYQVLSRVVLRDMDGRYRTAVHNSAAPYYGVERKRYVIPANEFVDSPGLDANRRIRQSMKKKEQVRVTLPGIVPVYPGRAVRVADDALTLGNLLAEEIVWRQDAAGVTTELTLVSSLYYN